ncbi:STAS domain-containing protein [Clostridium sp.]|uniref:STAS domain-containing protein n=1 Tax=Clostridium sp. TaxID=1506 RepID=UPI00284E11D5|nr:STAS domain-containing protein [Clostridium sp.]MDR3596214.1 STAS domain-containing protein [Clostridium sp.]
MNEISVIIPENFVTDEATQFRKRIVNLIRNGEKNFNIDFSKCNFIDNTGLGALMVIHNKCIKINGRLKFLAVNNPNVIKIFELAELINVFEIRSQI